MKRFRFGGVLKKYERLYTLVQAASGKYDDDGVWIPSEPKRVNLRGNIQPVSDKLQQIEGGRYSEDDRVLYTLNQHENGELIEYEGKQYNIESLEPRDYLDVNKYILKARVANAPV